MLFQGGISSSPGSSASPRLAPVPRSLQRQRRQAPAARASADGARPQSRSRARRGWKPAPSAGLGHGALGREAAQRAKHGVKGQQPQMLLVLHHHSLSHFLAKPGAPDVTHRPHSAHLPHQSFPQASSAQRNHSRALCHLPPDLQLQLQDLCSSCSSAEGTRRLLVGSSHHTPPSHPREPLTAARTVQKKQALNAGHSPSHTDSTLFTAQDEAWSV